MKHLLALAITWLVTSRLFAQTDSIYTASYIDRSTRFAWTTLGGDLLALSGGTTDYLRNGSVSSTDFGSTLLPRLTIGGVHFWGHADFYVTFPLTFLALRHTPDVFRQFTYQSGIETGARIYPLRLAPNKLRPFAGISMQLRTFGHQVAETDYAEGNPEFQRLIAPLQFGFTYATDKYLLTVSSYYQFLQDFDYYIAPNQTGAVQVNPLAFNISFLRYWDTDRSMRSAEALDQLNRKHQVLEQENRMSTWYWGIGPSAGLQMSRSEFLKNNYPYLYDDFAGGFMPDVTFGRFFAKPDVNVGLSYRTLGYRLNGFDTEIKLRRHSFMLETYKNLFNWLGFVPFVGVTGSLEQLSANINGTRYEALKPTVGLIFGWDIRVTKTGTSLLRTNLRWAPDLHLDIAGEQMMFNHLEFNFIQWVTFIGRKQAYLKYSKQ